MSVFTYIWKTQSNFTSNFFRYPQYRYWCENELIYIRDFDVVQKTRSRVLSGVKTLGFASRFLTW